jgi:GH18 family chitinase
MRSSAFNAPATSDWPLFTSVEKVRSQFADGTKVMVAIGGWGDTEGFEEAARSEEGRRLFARNVKAMAEFTGADGGSLVANSNWRLIAKLFRC